MFGSWTENRYHVHFSFLLEEPLYQNVHFAFIQRAWFSKIRYCIFLLIGQIFLLIFTLLTQKPRVWGMWGKTFWKMKYDEQQSCVAIAFIPPHFLDVVLNSLLFWTFWDRLALWNFSSNEAMVEYPAALRLRIKIFLSALFSSHVAESSHTCGLLELF